MWRDLALFNLAIDGKLRACDLVRLRIDEVCSRAKIRHRATVVQKKTGRPVQFEITEQTKASLEAWLRMLRTIGSRYLFPSRLHARAHLSTRQYARLVHRRVDSIGLDSISYGTHSMRGRPLRSIARQATFVPSSSYSAIQNWRAPSVISESR
jgi:integrase